MCAPPASHKVRNGLFHAAKSILPSCHSYTMRSPHRCRRTPSFPRLPRRGCVGLWPTPLPSTVSHTAWSPISGSPGGVIPSFSCRAQRQRDSAILAPSPWRRRSRPRSQRSAVEPTVTVRPPAVAPLVVLGALAAPRPPLLSQQVLQQRRRIASRPGVCSALAAAAAPLRAHPGLRLPPQALPGLAHCPPRVVVDMPRRGSSGPTGWGRQEAGSSASQRRRAAVRRRARARASA